MVIPELDIWRGWASPKPRLQAGVASNLLIQQHGANAVSEAARFASQMLDPGESAARLLWTRIRLAIEAQQAPRRGEPN